MKKNALEIYSLAVCFTSVMVFIVTVVITVYGVMGYVYPEFGVSAYAYKKHLTNDAFWEKGYDCSSREDDMARPPEDVLTKRRIASYEGELAASKMNAFQSMIFWAVALLIDVVVFFVHWRLARHARENSVTVAA